ncbi:DDB1- and CUL4-associated factor 11 isoform X1 [Halyomorpha halys]|uniref:DDB1- and CUL4-associated factor 11 isoform X1 n=1 Tax=Halyomorpha halys TaxID=286706 RepID=UPI0006D4EE2E|nr:DDB1- and CUL4-associated factor 11 isoform X2 [Halyomorpha halys]
MGLTKSRDMARAIENRPADDVSGSEGSDSESDLASILQYLIRSGQVRILGRDQPYLGPFPKPPLAGTPNLDNFHKSEISFLTKQGCGLLPRCPRTISKAKCPSKSITDMITNRESGQLKGFNFSPDDKRVIGNCKLPTKMKNVDMYENKAFCGIYSHDGNMLVTAAQDRFLRTYDCSNSYTFKELQVIQGRDIGWSVLDTTFSPDSSKVAYSSWSSCVHMVEVDKGDNGRHVSLPLCPEERRFCVFSLMFSNKGNEILCGANDGHIYIYNLARNDRTMRIEAHDDDVNAVAFADETSNIIFSGGDDGFCKVWDRRLMPAEGSPKPVGVLAGHLDGITYIDSRFDGHHFISNSKDQSIKLWDIRVMSSRMAQECTRKAVNSNKWDYRWQTAPRKLITRKTNIKGDTSIATYRGHSVLQTLIRCHFSPKFSTGQRYIVTGCAFGRIVVYDILTGNMVLKLRGHSSVVRDVSWHPWRPEMISSSWDFSVLCWNHYGINHDTTENDLKPSCWEDEQDWNSTQHLRRSRRIADRARTFNALT